MTCMNPVSPSVCRRCLKREIISLHKTNEPSHRSTEACWDLITVLFLFELTLFSPLFRTNTMAMVSEFLGQLTLNTGVLPYIWSFHPVNTYIISTVDDCFILISDLHRIPQLDEPTYPTVVPTRDFDPDKDAARIETAIKTKGKILCQFALLAGSATSLSTNG